MFPEQLMSQLISHGTGLFERASKSNMQPVSRGDEVLIASINRGIRTSVNVIYRPRFFLLLALRVSNIIGDKITRVIVGHVSTLPRYPVLVKINCFIHLNRPISGGSPSMNETE